MLYLSLATGSAIGLLLFYSMWHPCPDLSPVLAGGCVPLALQLLPGQLLILASLGVNASNLPIVFRLAVPSCHHHSLRFSYIGSVDAQQVPRQEEPEQMSRWSSGIPLGKSYS